MFDFSGKHVLVTGAAAGIGLGIAECFHRAGANVSLGDFRPDALVAARSTLGADRTFGFEVDVREEEQIERFFTAAEETFGPVDIVVANAGVIPSVPVIDMTVEQWDRVMDTNARGCFLTCRAAARSMVNNGTLGKIVTLSSIAANAARVEAAHYCASKAAILTFSKSLALELAKHRINVNIIQPGYVEVESEVSPLSEAYKDAMRAAIPLGRPGCAEDIGNMAMFLASEYSEYVTGETFVVSGGSSAGRANLPPANP